MNDWKELATILQSMSGDAKVAFEWWLATRLLDTVVCALGFIGVFWIISRTIQRCFIAYRVWYRLAPLMGWSTTWSDGFSSSEADAIVDFVRTAKAKKS